MIIALPDVKLSPSAGTEPQVSRVFSSHSSPLSKGARRPGFETEMAALVRAGMQPRGWLSIADEVLGRSALRRLAAGTLRGVLDHLDLLDAADLLRTGLTSVLRQPEQRTSDLLPGGLEAGRGVTSQQFADFVRRAVLDLTGARS